MSHADKKSDSPIATHPILYTIWYTWLTDLVHSLLSRTHSLTYASSQSAPRLSCSHVDDEFLSGLQKSRMNASLLWDVSMFKQTFGSLNWSAAQIKRWVLLQNNLRKGLFEQQSLVTYLAKNERVQVERWIKIKVPGKVWAIGGIKPYMSQRKLFGSVKCKKSNSIW